MGSSALSGGSRPTFMSAKTPAEVVLADANDWAGPATVGPSPPDGSRRIFGALRAACGTEPAENASRTPSARDAAPDPPPARAQAQPSTPGYSGRTLMMYSPPSGAVNGV